MTDARTRHEEVTAPWDDALFDARAWAAQRAAERERRRQAERRIRRVRGLTGLAVLAALALTVSWSARGAVGPFASALHIRDAPAAANRSNAAAGRRTDQDRALDAGEAVSARPGRPSGVSTSSAPSLPATKSPAAAAGTTEDAVGAAAVPYPGPPAVPPEVISRARPAEKLVAITIDDGLPIDERILDLLIERDVRVTTFLLGQAVVARPALVRRMRDAGLEIATHGWDHASFTKMSPSQMRSQLARTQDAISGITGNQAPYFRPPYGARSETVDSVAAELGYRVVLWDVSFVDTYENATPRYCADKVLANLHPGAIILCHWGRPATYEAMRILLDELEMRGYRVVTVSELLAAPRAEMR